MLSDHCRYKNFFNGEAERKFYQNRYLGTRVFFHGIIYCGFIGLGLIGGSIAKAIHQKLYRLVSYSLASGYNMRFQKETLWNWHNRTARNQS